MEFSNWDNGQPDNAFEKGEHCVHLHLSGAWNDLDCYQENFTYTEMRAICQ